MMIKTATSFAFRRCLPGNHTGRQRANGWRNCAGDSASAGRSADVNWNPQRNVIESQKYDRPGGNKPGFSDGPDAQGVLVDNRSATS